MNSKVGQGYIPWNFETKWQKCQDLPYTQKCLLVHEYLSDFQENNYFVIKCVLNPVALLVPNITPVNVPSNFPSEKEKKKSFWITMQVLTAQNMFTQFVKAP